MRAFVPHLTSNASSPTSEAPSPHSSEDDDDASDNDEGPVCCDERHGGRGRPPLLLASFLLSQLDYCLDGWVVVMLLEQGSIGSAAILVMIVLVPQLVMWLFLCRYGRTSLESLARILVTPGLVAAVVLAACLLPPDTVPPATLRSIVCCTTFYISFSMESLYLLKEAGKRGDYDVEGWWATIGRDLIQPPLSGVFTLYLVLSNICPMETMLMASVISSTLNFTKSATQLNFYSKSASPWSERARFAVAHTFPRALWRVISLALLAHVLRPKEEMEAARSYWLGRLFVFSAYDLLRNFLILHIATPGQLLIPVLALLSFNMLFTGPPRFLTYLGKACIEHYTAQLLYFVFALCATLYLHLDGNWSKGVLHLWQSHTKIVIVWAISMLWSLASALILYRWYDRNDERDKSDKMEKKMATEKLRAAAKDGDVILCSLLLELGGASRSEAKGWLETSFIDLGGRWREAEDKWRGIAACDDYLYGAPKDATEVLVVHSKTEAVSYLSLPGDLTSAGDKGFFRGITACGKKLYCTPSDAEAVLVIDSTTMTTSTIPLPSEVRKLRKKFAGIVELDGKLYCAPRKANFVLVVDVGKQEASVIKVPEKMTGKGESSKFSGIAALHGKLYCCPRFADKVLVVEPGGRMSTIDLPEGFQGKENKWSGIAACGNKLYCAPLNAHGVLVIDPAKRKTSIIPLPHNTGNFKWSSIRQHKGRLYCCPHNSTDMLIIDPDGEEGEQLITVLIDPTPVGRAGKWSSLAVGSDERLFCSPFAASKIAVVDVGESFLVDEVLKRARLCPERPERVGMW